MHTPVIAFDCDDVLVASGSPMVRHYNLLHKTTAQHKDFYSKDYENLWQTDQETATRDLFAYLLTDEYLGLVPMEGARETLQRMAKNYTLYIVTGRPDETKTATKNWVDKQLPGIFEDIVFTNYFKLENSEGPKKSKSEVCKELGASWLVDDHLNHVRDASNNGLTGILFGNLPWEQLNNPEQNIVKINNWQKLGQYFQQIDKKQERTNSK